jgi:hypothetical protein
VPFILDIPEVIEIEPKLVQWELNGALTPKDVKVKMTGTEPMRVLKVTATRENMSYTIKEVTPGREYVVTLTPKSTADIMMGALKLETDSKIPKYQRQLAFFSVARAAKGADKSPAEKP